MASTLLLCTIPNKTHTNRHNLSTIAVSPAAQQDLIQDLLVHKASFDKANVILDSEWQSLMKMISNPKFIDSLSTDPQKHKDYIAEVDAVADNYHKTSKEIDDNWVKLRDVLGKTNTNQLPSYKHTN